MWARRFSPSKQRASRRPLPSILITWAYSGGEMLEEREKEEGEKE